MDRPDTQRLFIGASLPREEVDAILPVLGHFRDINTDAARFNWIQPEEYHVTLYFFGSTSPLQLSNIMALCSLAAKRIPAFTLTTHSFCLQPIAHRPRMMWLRFGYAQEYIAATQVFQSLWKPLAPQVQFRQKPTPHLTLARIPEEISSRTATIILPQAPIFSFPVSRLTLWNSHPEGHIPLAQVQLRK